MLKETELFQADLGKKPEFSSIEKKQIEEATQKRNIVTCADCGVIVHVPENSQKKQNQKENIKEYFLE